MAPTENEDTSVTALSKASPDDVALVDAESRGVKHDAKQDPDTTSEGEYSEEGEITQDCEQDVADSFRNGSSSKAHDHPNPPSSQNGNTPGPPLPDEAIPPLPAEPHPSTAEVDDGWAPIWEESAQAFYFYNRFTHTTQWTNPRVPEAPHPSAPDTEPAVPVPSSSPPTISGYNPAIHGDYDPTAWYAQPSTPSETFYLVPGSVDPAAQYAATAAFNRFTGRFQNSDLNPENFNDENKSKRQMNAFFDVDAAANSHDGRSLKAERSGKKLSKEELKQFKEKRKAKKEEKRRAWLRD